MRGFARRTFLIIFAILAALPLPAASAETVRLRVADYLPNGHFLARFLTHVWMERVAELTGDKVVFDYFPAEQLGKSKDLLSLAQTRVAHIALAAPSYISDKLPLSMVAELPGGPSTSCEASLAFWELAKEGGIIDRAELEPLGVKVVYAIVLPPYQLYVSKGALNSLDAVRGKKIRSGGGAKVLVARRIGAVPIHMGGPELMESLSRGTIDGLFLSHASIRDYRLHNVLSAGTQTENFGTAVITYVINRKTWRELPEDVRRAADQASDDVVASGCAETDKDTRRSVDTIRSGGVTVANLPREDSDKLRATVADVNRAWAEGLDKRGKPGSVVLKAYEEALARVNAGNAEP